MKVLRILLEVLRTRIVGHTSLHKHKQISKSFPTAQLFQNEFLMLLQKVKVPGLSKNALVVLRTVLTVTNFLKWP